MILQGLYTLGFVLELNQHLITCMCSEPRNQVNGSTSTKLRSIRAYSLLCVKTLRKKAGIKALDLPELQQNYAVGWSTSSLESPVLLQEVPSAAAGVYGLSRLHSYWLKSVSAWQMGHGQVSAGA